MRYETKHARIVVYAEEETEMWGCFVGVFDPAGNGRKDGDTLLHWEESHALMSGDEAMRAAGRIEREALEAAGYDENGKELTMDEKIERDPGGYADYLGGIHGKDR